MSANIDRNTARTSGFIPQVWAQKALDVLRANIVLLSMIARDVDYVPVPQGETVNIPYPGTFTARKKTEGTPATTQRPVGGATVPVTLSELAYVDFVVSDFARVQASSELLDRYVTPAAIAIAEQVETDLFSVYPTFTGGTVDATATGVDEAAIMAAASLLDEAKCPQTDRALVVSSRDKYRVLSDPALKTYFAFQRPEAIQKGEIGEAYNFRTLSSQLVPKVGTSPVVNKNLALHKSAMIIALRGLPEPEPGSGVDAQTIVDEDSGLAIRVMRAYDIAERGHRITLDVLYGYRQLRPELGVLIESHN